MSCSYIHTLDKIDETHGTIENIHLHPKYEVCGSNQIKSIYYSKPSFIMFQ